MEKEIWKPVKFYESLYEVSSLGRVRSLDRTVVYKDGRKGFYKGKILRLNKCTTSGYLFLTLSKNNKHKIVNVHRLVAEAFILNLDNYPVVNHLDGNKQNNCVENLEWTTYHANNLHAVRHSLMKSGADSHKAKLTWEQVKEIRELYTPHSKEYNMDSLAKKYGLLKQSIYFIIHNKTYYDESYIPPKQFLKRKLTFAQAEEIRRIYIHNDKNFGARPLARKYNVSQPTILDILHYKTYKSE